MMPKGVEHYQKRVDEKFAPKVRIPMMPKGVEHNFPVAIRSVRTP